MTAARRELVTLPDPERVDTLPAPPNLSPAVHEHVLQLVRLAPDISISGLELLVSIAEQLRERPLERGKLCGDDGVRWHLHVWVGRGPENFRAGGRT